MLAPSTRRAQANAARAAALESFLRTPASRNLTIKEIAARSGCGRKLILRLNNQIYGPRRSADRVSREVEPSLPKLAIRVGIANLYLARLALPCQCSNRLARTFDRLHYAPRVYRTPNVPGF